MSNKLLFIGEFPPPYGGVTVKDSLLRDEIFSSCDAKTFDLYDFKRRPIALPSLAIALARAVRGADRIALGIGSNSRQSTMLGIIAKLRGREFLGNVTVFMMGRELADYLGENPGQVWKYQAARCVFAESRSLMADFETVGCRNSRYLSNFRRGDRARAPRAVGDTVHFVYFAQVRPEKGIDTLAAAARTLNSEGLADKFDIAVYGTVVDGFQNEFERLLSDVPNMTYKGAFDAATGDVCAELNMYDAAVSSSSWREGMSGSNIECKFAGVANIVSDAGFNPECVGNGVDGLIVRPRNVGSLVEAMRSVIEDRGLLARLKRNSYEDRVNYDVATWKREVLDVVCG